MRSVIPLVLIIVSCGSPDQDEIVDLRIEIPAAPEQGVQWVVPDFEVPPFDEVVMCYFDTYLGPDVGIEEFNGFQSPGGHHVVVNGTTVSNLDYEDGAHVECTESEMIDLDPILVGGELGNEANQNRTTLRLSDGMAAKLRTGQRIIVQSHYINYTAEPVLVRDVANFFTVDTDIVETWTAPFVHIQTEHPIAAGESRSLEFTCEFDADVSILFVGGHMHEFGTSFSVDLNREDSSTERFYEILEWDTWMRDAPPYEEYVAGDFNVRAGESFTTTCNWTNNGPVEVDFPTEMCATFGMAFPAETPMICVVE